MSAATAPRVLVLWADDCSANLGVRVLARGAAALARAAWGPDVVVDLQDFKGAQSDTSFGKKSLLRDALWPGGPVGAKLARYDVVLDSGAGDSFTDIYGLKRMLAIMYTQRRALRLGVPVVLGPQTVGPFGSPVGTAGARYVVGRAHLVLPRDSTSARHAEELGAAPGQTASDVVFALPVPRAAQGSLDVVLNVSGLLWHQNPHVDHLAYRQHVVALGRALVAEGRHVTLLAHVLDNPSTDNDVPAVHAAAALVGGGVRCVVPSDLDEVRRVVADARVVVGSRMHACLNALSVGTPSIAWSYSRKFAPLMSDLGWELGVDLRTCDDPVAETVQQLQRVDTPAVREALTAAVRHGRDALDAAALRMARAVPLGSGPLAAPRPPRAGSDG